MTSNSIAIVIESQSDEHAIINFNNHGATIEQEMIVQDEEEAFDMSGWIMHSWMVLLWNMQTIEILITRTFGFFAGAYETYIHPPRRGMVVSLSTGLSILRVD